MSDVKGYVYRVRPGHWQWQVIRNGVLIATDNTGSWRPVYGECRRVVEAFRIVDGRDHTTTPNCDHGTWLASLRIGGAS